MTPSQNTARTTLERQALIHEANIVAQTKSMMGSQALIDKALITIAAEEATLADINRALAILPEDPRA